MLCGLAGVMMGEVVIFPAADPLQRSLTALTVALAAQAQAVAAWRDSLDQLRAATRALAERVEAGDATG